MNGDGLPGCSRRYELALWLFAQTTHVIRQLPDLFIGFDLCETWHAAAKFISFSGQEARNHVVEAFRDFRSLTRDLAA